MSRRVVISVPFRLCKSLIRYAGVTVFVFGFSGCAVKRLTTEMGNPRWGVEVRWHGQSCFTLRDSLGRTIVIDPFDETVGYGRISLQANALLMTHDHFDHNYKPAMKGRFGVYDLVEGTGTATVASGLLVTGIPSEHDNEGGQIHGSNTMYSFVMGGLRCLHMGDLGQLALSPYQKKMIGTVDVLFIPVGGETTLDPRQAKAFVDELKPSVVFPMHYGDIRFYRLEKVESFANLFKPEQVRVLSESHVRIRNTDRNENPLIYILSPVSKNY